MGENYEPEWAVRSLSIVIPTYRGITRLPDLLDRLETALVPGTTTHPPIGTVEVIIVDDGSPTSDQRSLGEYIADRNQRIDNDSISPLSPAPPLCYQTVCLPNNKGQQYATIAGIGLTRGDAVATIDDDGGHPPEHLIEMVEQMWLHPEIDLMYGAPYRGHGARSRPLLRRVGTLFNNVLFWGFAGKPLSVPVTSFRVIRRRLVDKALRLPVRYAYLSAMLFYFHPTVSVLRYSPPDGEMETRYSPRRLINIFWNLCLFWGPFRVVGAVLRPARFFDLPKGCD